MAASVVRRRVVVRGRVQGVFFRDSLRDCAERAGVAGWARNCSDGTVEVALEGCTGAVDQVVEFCRQGPPRARVDDLELITEEPEGLTGFETR